VLLRRRLRDRVGRLRDCRRGHFLPLSIDPLSAAKAYKK